jgi:Domain of unknown function (DUF4340)
MKNASLMKLGALAVGLLLAVVLMKNKGTPADSALSQESLVVPGLSEQLNAVSGIKLTGASNTPIISLKRTDKGWVADSINGYGADVSKIRDYLIKLSEAKIREAKTANPDSYTKLGVEDLKAADAKGIQLELEGLKTPVKLIMGSIAGSGGQGVYVRKPEDKQSYLASGQIRPEASVNSWIQAEIANIAANRVKEVTITPPTGEKLVVRKDKTEDADWAVLDVPKGKELSSPSVGNQLAGTLDALRLESVLPNASAEPDLSSTYRARYVTFEGVVVEVTAWEKDGKGYTRYAASMDTSVSETHILAEQAKAEAEAKAKAATATPPAPTTGADGKPLAASPITPVATPPAAFDAAKFRTEKLAELNKQIEEINQRTAGWSYVLPGYKFSNIKKTMADMLKVEGAPPAPGTRENPLNIPLGGQ